MSRYDATQTNESKRSSRIYKDLNLDFQKNTATKDIQKLTDAEAVKRSVRNLINTNHYERPFHPEIGSNLRAMLFENITPQITHVISKQIELLLKNYEPRCRLVQVNTQPMLDRNGYATQISFYVVNYPEPVTVETFLERLR
jgi:phage baseplate assembly protein W|tara:strand:+ start:1022 stop:1447 length:426 start_codon:yes stop_codon:yes gene_type:complete